MSWILEYFVVYLLENGKSTTALRGYDPDNATKAHDTVIGITMKTLGDVTVDQIMCSVALTWQHGGALAWRNIATVSPSTLAIQDTRYLISGARLVLGFGICTVTGTARTMAVPWQVLVPWQRHGSPRERHESAWRRYGQSDNVHHCLDLVTLFRLSISTAAVVSGLYGFRTGTVPGTACKRAIVYEFVQGYACTMRSRHTPIHRRRPVNLSLSNAAREYPCRRGDVLASWGARIPDTRQAAAAAKAAAAEQAAAAGLPGAVQKFFWCPRGRGGPTRSCWPRGSRSLGVVFGVGVVCGVRAVRGVRVDTCRAV